MAVSQKKRFEIFKRDGFKCQYCGRSVPDVTLQIDHIEPRAKGGKDGILNLVTSCSDCNLGKSDGMLSDGQIVDAQRKRLQELGERREQLKMMAAWQEELLNLEEEQIAELEKLWRQSVPYDWMPSGRETIRRALSQFGFYETSAAIRTAINQYLDFQEGQPTLDSATKAFNKIGRLAYLNTLDEDEKEIRHIANLLVKRTHYSSKWRIWELLRQQMAEHPLIPLSQIRAIAGECRSFSDFEVKLAALNEKEAAHA